MAKGGSFENEICSLLSLWFTDGKRDDIFGRSDASGARFTARKKKGKDTANQGGDITFTDIIGEPLIKCWSIEAKTGYGGKRSIKDKDGNLVKKIQDRWDVLDFIDSSQKETVLEMMWNQCCRDADLTNRKPILIFRRNQRKICIAAEKEYFQFLAGLYGKPSYKMIVVDPGVEEKCRIVIMLLKDFMSWIPDIQMPLCQIH